MEHPLLIMLSLLGTLHIVRMLLRLFLQTAPAALIPLNALLISPSPYFLPIDLDSHLVVLESRDTFVIYNLRNISLILSFIITSWHMPVLLLHFHSLEELLVEMPFWSSLHWEFFLVQSHSSLAAANGVFHWWYVDITILRSTVLLLVFLEKNAFSCAFELLFLCQGVERGAVMFVRLFRFEFIEVMDLVDRVSGI